MLLTHLNIGVRIVDPTIRRLTTMPYRYLVFYEISGDEIIIHAVRHSARDPSAMPGSE
jgi:toxin ParE1/3/4